MKKVDITGNKYGRLTVLSWHGHNNQKQRTWLCRCDCGTERIVTGSSLTTGNTTSCGCYSREATSLTFKKHGLTKTYIHRVWTGMKSRCHNPKTDKYSRYGGRGITVCDRWQYFENFLADMGMPPFPKAEIDRKDNNGNYEPSNCSWVTKKTNGRNTSTNVYWTFNGETKCITEWAETLGIGVSSLQARVSRLGWSIEKALTEPVIIGRNQYS